MTPNNYKYLVLRFVRDPIQDASVPFGLLYWLDDPTSFHLRLPTADEAIFGLPKEYKAFKDRFVLNVGNYLRTGHLPHGDGLTPYTDAWWAHFRSLFIHRFRVEGPRLVEIKNPSLDFELQFAALVKPTYVQQKEDSRIDSLLNESLGPLHSYFESYTDLEGYQDRPVRVLKKAVRKGKIVALDAVNLTRADAVKEFEAMLHRAWELRRRYTPEELDLILGYYASPGGLNGEAKLVHLGNEINGRPMVNLSTEIPALRAEIEAELGTKGT